MALHFVGGGTGLELLDVGRLDGAMGAGDAFTRPTTGYAEVDATTDVEEHAIDVPRFAYHPALAGEGRGLLVEPAWANLVAAPADLSAWSEQQGAGDALVDADAAAAPDGAVTADRVNFLAGGSDRGRSEFDAGLANGAKYMSSIYLKRDQAPHDSRVVNANAPADNVVNGTAAAGWVRVFRLDTVTGTVSSIYLRRNAGDGGSLLAWGAVRHADVAGMHLAYHPTGLGAEAYSRPNTNVVGARGTLGFDWVPLFDASAMTGQANEVVLRDWAGTGLMVTWAADDTPGYLRLYNNDFKYRQRWAPPGRLASLRDSISYEPYGSGTRSWNRRMGSLLAGGDQVLVAGGLNDKLAQMAARFATDVGDQGADVCLLLGGINDVVTNRTLAQMRADALTVAAAARAAGVRLISSPIFPFGGAASWSAPREAVRTGYNDWVRAGGLTREVVDGDLVLRDPAAPTQLLAAYHSRGHVHPSDAGGDAFADAVAAVL